MKNKLFEFLDLGLQPLANCFIPKSKIDKKKKNID